MGGDGDVEQTGTGDGSRAESARHEDEGVGPVPGWVVDADGTVDLTADSYGDSRGAETEAAAQEAISVGAGDGPETAPEDVEAGHQDGNGPQSERAVATDSPVTRRTELARRTVARRSLSRARTPGRTRADHRIEALIPPRRREQKLRRSWGQRLVLLTGTLAAVASAAAAAGIGYAYRTVEQIPRVELGHVLADAVASGEPRNVLLVGIDDPEGIAASDSIHNDRDQGPPLADTIMIMRVDPADQQARILSLPRDLWVTFPDTQSTSRINTAIWRGDGSPELLIDLIDDYLGIPIHNYVQVDLAGFRELVDEIGGVPVYFERPGRDRGSGLHVYETGCVTLDAEAALAFVRSRHYEEYVDGDWTREGLSDLARVQRQQAFIRHTLDRAVNQGARNPGTLNGLVNAGVGSVTLDDELTVRDLLDLGNQFQAFDSESMESYVLPADDGVVGGAQVLHMNEREAEPILERFRGDPVADEEAPPGKEDPTGSDRDSDRRGPQDELPDGLDERVLDNLVPAEVRVTVLNGSGQAGQATEAAAELDVAGFFIAGRDNAPQFGQARTEVRYPADLAAEAVFLERWLIEGADLVESPEAVEVTVVTGEDWRGVADSPRPPREADPEGPSDGLVGLAYPVPGLASLGRQAEETEPAPETDESAGGQGSTSTPSGAETPGELPAPRISC